MNRMTFVSAVVGLSLGLEFLIGDVAAQTSTNSSKKSTDNMANISVNQSAKPKLFFGASIDPVFGGIYNFGKGPDEISIDNIPLEIRNVPIHKDDWTPNSSNRFKGPIAEDELVNRNLSLMNAVKVYIGLGNNNSNLKSGITGVMTTTIQEMHKRDYTKDPATGMARQGAAYTFMTQNNAKLLYGYFIQGKTKIHDQSIKKMEDKIFFSISYRRLFENYGIITGWDRYNKLEIYKKYDVGTVFLDQLEAGLEYENKNQNLGIYIGYTQMRFIRLTELGNLMSLNTPNYKFIRVSYGVSLDTKNKKHK